MSKGITADNAVDACATACLDGSDPAVAAKMPNCAEHVTYRFCARAFTSADLEGSISATYVEETDAAAKACWEDTFWDSGTGCDDGVKRGACYLAFPRCAAADDAPLKICSSFCINERRECRGGGSAFGHLDTLKIARLHFLCHHP